MPLNSRSTIGINNFVRAFRQYYKMLVWMYCEAQPSTNDLYELVNKNFVAWFRLLFKPLKQNYYIFFVSEVVCFLSETHLFFKKGLLHAVKAEMPSPQIWNSALNNSVCWVNHNHAMVKLKPVHKPWTILTIKNCKYCKCNICNI